MAARDPDLAFLASLASSLDVESDVVRPRGRAGVEAAGPVERGGVEAEDVGVEVVAGWSFVFLRRSERKKKRSVQSVVGESLTASFDDGFRPSSCSSPSDLSLLFSTP